MNKVRKWISSLLVLAMLISCCTWLGTTKVYASAGPYDVSNVSFSEATLTEEGVFSLEADWFIFYVHTYDKDNQLYTSWELENNASYSYKVSVYNTFSKNEFDIVTDGSIEADDPLVDKIHIKTADSSNETVKRMLEGELVLPYTRKGDKPIDITAFKNTETSAYQEDYSGFCFEYEGKLYTWQITDVSDNSAYKSLQLMVGDQYNVKLVVWNDEKTEATVIGAVSCIPVSTGNYWALIPNIEGYTGRCTVPVSYAVDISRFASETPEYDPSCYGFRFWRADMHEAFFWKANDVNCDNEYVTYHSLILEEGHSYTISLVRDQGSNKTTIGTVTIGPDDVTASVVPAPYFTNYIGSCPIPFKYPEKVDLTGLTFTDNDYNNTLQCFEVNWNDNNILLYLNEKTGSTRMASLNGLDGTYTYKVLNNDEVTIAEGEVTLTAGTEKKITCEKLMGNYIGSFELVFNEVPENPFEKISVMDKVKWYNKFTGPDGKNYSVNPVFYGVNENSEEIPVDLGVLEMTGTIRALLPYNKFVRALKTVSAKAVKVTAGVFEWDEINNTPTTAGEPKLIIGSINSNTLEEIVNEVDDFRVSIFGKTEEPYNATIFGEALDWFDEGMVTLSLKVTPEQTNISGAAYGVVTVETVEHLYSLSFDKGTFEFDPEKKMYYAAQDTESIAKVIVKDEQSNVIDEVRFIYNPESGFKTDLQSRDYLVDRSTLNIYDNDIVKSRFAVAPGEELIRNAYGQIAIECYTTKAPKKDFTYNNGKAFSNDDFTVNSNSQIKITLFSINEYLCEELISAYGDEEVINVISPGSEEPVQYPVRRFMIGLPLNDEGVYKIYINATEKYNASEVLNFTVKYENKKDDDPTPDDPTPDDPTPDKPTVITITPRYEDLKVNQLPKDINEIEKVKSFKKADGTLLINEIDIDEQYADNNDKELKIKVDEENIELKKDDLKKIINTVKDTDNSKESLTVEGDNYKMSFDAKALTTMEEESKGNTVRIVAKDKAEGFTDLQIAAIKKENTLMKFEAYVESNKVRIHDFKGGEVKININVKRLEGLDPYHMFVYYIDEYGNMQRMDTRVAGGNSLEFRSPHLSDYIVVYDDDRTNGYIDYTAVFNMSKEMYVGSTFNIVMTANNTEVSFESSDESVVTVSEDGVLTGKKAGTANVTVKSGDYAAVFKIDVKDAEKTQRGTDRADAPALETDGAALTVMKKVTKKSKVWFDDAEGATISYKTSNDCIQITKNGELKRVKPGKCYVDITVEQGGVAHTYRVVAD